MNFIFKRKTPFLLFLTVLFLGGLYQLKLIPIQLYPQTQRIQFYLSINHNGYSAQDFESDYGADIITDIAALANIDKYTATYRRNRSTFFLTFKWNTDKTQAESATISAASVIKNRLPKDFNVRSYFSDGTEGNGLQSSVGSLSAEPSSVYATVKRVLVPKLKQQLVDIDYVELSPLQRLSVKVILKPEVMLAAKISITDVNTVFSNGYLASSGGSIKIDGDRRNAFSIRINTDVLSIDQIGNLVIAERNGQSIRLKDIADISFAYELPKTVYSINDQQVLALYVQPKSGANIRQIATDTKRIFDEAVASGELPADYFYNAIIDPAQFINKAIYNILLSGFLGALLAVSIILLTLGQVRSSLLVVISLPFSIVLSFWLMKFFNVSINLISLGGIALSVGMIVDASIVVIENIDRRMRDLFNEENASLVASNVGDGKARKKQVIMDATKEVAPAVAVSTLTSILVFLPLVFTAPLSAAILGEQALTVIFSLVFSVIISLVFIPLFANMFFKLDNLQKESRLHKLTHWVEFVLKYYLKSLKQLLAHKSLQIILVGSFLLLVATASFVIYPRIQQEFLPVPNGDLIVISQSFSEEIEQGVLLNTNLPEFQKKVLPLLDKDLYKDESHPKGKSFSFAYTSSLLVFYQVKNPKKVKGLIEKLKKEFPSTDDVTYEIESWDPAELPLPERYDLEINLNTISDEQASEILLKIRDFLKDYDDIVWTRLDPYPSYNKDLVFSPRRGVFESNGLSSANLARMIRIALSGTSNLEFILDGEKIKVAAKYPEDYLDSLDSLLNFPLIVQDKYVLTSHFFDVTRDSSVSTLYSENAEKKFRVRLVLEEGLSANKKLEIVAQIKEDLAKEFDASLFNYPDPNPDLTSSIKSLGQALLVSIILIYLLLCFQFGSLREPCIVLIAIPPALIGVVMSLWLFRSTLSLNSMLGAILLCGVAVNNSIIMLDFYLNLLKEHFRKHTGLDATEKLHLLEKCVALRFKPILITTATTFLGMLPIALGLGQGSSIIQPLGIAVAGGLLFSTLMTLYLVPLAILHLGKKT